jgi:hypothetical protein
MFLISIPFIIAAVLVALKCNAFAAIAIGWFLMVSVVRGLTVDD